MLTHKCKAELKLCTWIIEGEDNGSVGYKIIILGNGWGSYKIKIVDSCTICGIETKEN